MSATLTEMTMQEVLESDFQTQHTALAALVKALKPTKGGRRKAAPEDGEKAPPKQANDYMVLVNKVVLPALRSLAEEADTEEEKTTLMSASCRSQIASLWFYNAERNPGFSALKEMTPEKRKDAMEAITEEDIRAAYDEWAADRPDAHCKADKETRSVASKGSSAASKTSRKAPMQDVAEMVKKLAEKRLDIKDTTMDNLKLLWSKLTGEEKPPSKLTRKKEELYNECLRLQGAAAEESEEEEAPKPTPKPKTTAPKPAPTPKEEPKTAPKAAPKPKEEPIPVSNAAAGGPDEEEDEFSEEDEEDEEEESNLPDGRIKVMLKPNGTDAQKAYWTLEKDKKTFIWDGDSMEFLGLYFKNNNKIHAKAIDPLDSN
jgi:hypothetical protein